MKKPETIDEYIASFSEDIQVRLKAVRETIQKAAPQATEAISYGLPTFKLNGKNLVHFGGFKHHIGFYPTPSGITGFEKELEPYKRSKGSVIFPHEIKLPLPLIRKIVKSRMKECS